MFDTEFDADQFAGYLILQGLADNTVRSYRCLFVRWCDFAHDRHRNPYLPDPITVRAWAASMEGTRSLIAQARATIGHLCAMVDSEDVSAAIPLPRRPRNLRSRALRPEQARRLAVVADQLGLAGLAVLVGLYTGARRGEIASLAWSNIDWHENTLTLSRPKTRDRHTVPLPAALRARLEQRHVPGDLWVFPGRHGGHVTAACVGEWVLDVATAAGLGHVTAHRLRHTYITDVHDLSGGQLRIAQDAAGHTDPSVTARYTRVDDHQLREVTDRLPYLDPGGDDVAGQEAA